MKIINDITNFIFVEDKPINVDIIFIPGSSKHELSEFASSLYLQGIAKYILPSGKFSSKLNCFPSEKIKLDKYKGKYESDWHFCYEVLKKNDVPEKVILREDNSTNTYENAFFSKKVLEEKNIEIKTAVICCQAFHARRTLITYSWAFPNVKFYICPCDTQGISKDNWYKTEYGINRVLGELRKCGTYFEEYINELSKKLK